MSAHIGIVIVGRKPSKTGFGSSDWIWCLISCLAKWSSFDSTDWIYDPLEPRVHPFQSVNKFHPKNQCIMVHPNFTSNNTQTNDDIKYWAHPSSSADRVRCIKNKIKCSARKKRKISKEANFLRLSLQQGFVLRCIKCTKNCVQYVPKWCEEFTWISDKVHLLGLLWKCVKSIYGYLIQILLC